jgi:hypothetical protein
MKAGVSADALLARRMHDQQESTVTVLRLDESGSAGLALACPHKSGSGAAADRAYANNWIWSISAVSRSTATRMCFRAGGR